jgi:methionine aminotransferase
MPEFKGLIRSKLPAAGTTIFAIMSGLAQQTGAINLSQGFPDFPVSEELMRLVYDNMRKGHNQYAPMPGLISLRERIAEKMENRFGAKYNPETEITITAGGTQALYAAITALIHEEDEVIVIEPAYDSYNPAIELAGGKAVHLNLEPPDYKIVWSKVKKLITPKTKMIMINSPHNPTGSVLTEKDLQQLDELTKSTDIIVLSDEVYEHIIFDRLQHNSVAKYPSLAQRSMIVYSFGKTFHATGWKCGYCVGPANLMKEFRKVHQFMVFSVNTPLQYALAEYMQNASHYNGLESFYQEKRDYFRSLLEGSPFKILPCSGSYFQLLDYSAVSNEKDTEYAIRLTKEYGIASIPVSVFYNVPRDYHLLRFCFAKSNETLEKAAACLHKVKA